MYRLLLVGHNISVTSFVAIFQTTFVICLFFFLLNYRFERSFYVKLND